MSELTPDLLADRAKVGAFLMLFTVERDTKDKLSVLSNDDVRRMTDEKGKPLYRLDENNLTRVFIKPDGANGPERCFTCIEGVQATQANKGFNATAWAEIDAASGKPLKDKFDVIAAFPGFSGDISKGLDKDVAIAVKMGNRNPNAEKAAAFADDVMKSGFVKQHGGAANENIAAVNVAGHSMGAGAAMLSAKYAFSHKHKLTEVVGIGLEPFAQALAFEHVSADLAKAHNRSQEEIKQELGKSLYSVRSVQGEGASKKYTMVASMSVGSPLDFSGKPQVNNRLAGAAFDLALNQAELERREEANRKATGSTIIRADLGHRLDVLTNQLIATGGAGLKQTNPSPAESAKFPAQLLPAQTLPLAPPPRRKGVAAPNDDDAVKGAQNQETEKPKSPLEAIIGLIVSLISGDFGAIMSAFTQKEKKVEPQPRSVVPAAQAPQGQEALLGGLSPSLTGMDKTAEKRNR